MKTLKDLQDVRGKRVFLRVDFNVPLEHGRITDYYRIEKALPTIQNLRARGAKIILASHIENKEGAAPSMAAPTLGPVYSYLRGMFGGDLIFVENYFPEKINEAVAGQQEGQIVLLENLRKYPQEKDNDDIFAKHLASFADIYVNDSFAADHRKHASIVGIPKHIPGCTGLLVDNEVKHLSMAFNPPHPFLFILGGAKFDTKLPLVKKFLGLADKVFVGGALANDLFKAKGFEVGKSLLSENADISDIIGSEKLILPADVVISNEQGSKTVLPTEVTKKDLIVDSGERTLEALKNVIAEAECILWNGPLGNFEIGFSKGTEELAKMISESHAKTIIGGGDTLASISKLGLEKSFTFVSTGGGAMLDFLANGTLPALEALN